MNPNQPVQTLPGGAASAELVARFEALRAGAVTLAVTHAGVHVKGSPWQARPC